MVDHLLNACFRLERLFDAIISLSNWIGPLIFIYVLILLLQCNAMNIIPSEIHYSPFLLPLSIASTSYQKQLAITGAHRSPFFPNPHSTAGIQTISQIVLYS